MDHPRDPSDSRASQFLFSTFVLLATSWLVYACRLYTRLRIVKATFSEDYFMLVGMVALTVFAAMVPVQTTHGGGQHLVDVVDHSRNIPQWGWAFFVAQIMYLVTLWGVKVSVASLLLRFTTSRSLVWSLRLVAAFVTIATVAFVFWVTFQCQPVQSQWDPSIPGVCQSRKTYMTSVYVLSSISAATDIIMAVAPILIIRRLQVDKRTKWYASITMGFGSLACVATLVRFKFIRDFSVSEDVTYAMVPLSICSFVEVSLGCICASLTTLRPLLQKMGIERHSLRAGQGQGSCRVVTGHNDGNIQLQERSGTGDSEDGLWVGNSLPKLDAGA